MRTGRWLVIFCYGFFTIAAQTLLFRSYLTTFEGNDISVGIFFGCWFLWVTVSALIAGRVKSFGDRLVDNFELVFLCYLPAFIIEFFLIVAARPLAGVESYTLISISTVLVLSVFVSAPVSVLTGMIFPTLCRWMQQIGPSPIRLVYILEAAGSFCGGLAVTALLSIGAGSARIFLLLSLMLCFSLLLSGLLRNLPAVVNRSGRRKRLAGRITFGVFVFLLFCLLLRADEAVSSYVRTVRWSQLLPRESLKGFFYTPQAEYLYGLYRDQWIVVSRGSVVDTLPDDEAAGRIAAMTLAQRPDAKSVFIIGSGLGLCRQFLKLGQTESVAWGHFDRQYLVRLNSCIPPEYKIMDSRFGLAVGDARRILAGQRQSCDIVIVNLPDATSSVLNRYYTYQFYKEVKQALRDGGILAVRIAGGENVMGTELVSLGASTKLTLEKVFSRLVFVPGDNSWFIASDAESITGEPGILMRRFASIAGSERIYPAEGLFSLYLPDRAAGALDNYAKATLPPRLLFNRDSRPLATLYSLLLSARQSGARFTRLIKALAVTGPFVFLVPVVLVVFLRLLYILRATGASEVERFDSPAFVRSSFEEVFLVFTAGWAAIGVVIILMFLYQSRFGSLYLHIGIISSVFMVGLTAGAILTSAVIRVISRFVQGWFAKLIVFILLMHAVVLIFVGFYGAERWGHISFAAAFFFSGLCSGCYFPLAAGALCQAGFETGQAAARLESADHLGGAVGAFVTALVLVPVFGTRAAVVLLSLLLLSNLAPVLTRRIKGYEFVCTERAGFVLRNAGYVLFTAALSIVICSDFLVRASEKARPSLPQYAAQALAGDARIEKKKGTVDGSSVSYFDIYQADDVPAGYIFSTKDLAPEVRGFGGRFNLAVFVDANGVLKDFHIVGSNETPSYLRLLGKWSQALAGHNLFESKPFGDVAAVTGATVSSEAIISAIEKSSARFAAGVLGRDVGRPAVKKVGYGSLFDVSGAYLILAFAVSLVVMFFGGPRSRIAVLAANLVLGGFVFNAQYSTEQIVTALSFNMPSAALTGAFLLSAGVVIAVLLFGNIYCGYVCPFGAAQELIGYLLPERLKPPVSEDILPKVRFIRYVLLFVLVVAFFVSHDRTTLFADPLISVFGLQRVSFETGGAVVLIVAAALVGSVFFTRFWCIYLCPVGGFLSLLNRFVLLKKYLPKKVFGRCEFFVSAREASECIYCDRCRYQPAKGTTAKAVDKERAATAGRWLVIGVALLAILVSVISLDRCLLVTGTGFAEQAVSATGGGVPRDVDLQKIETLIRQKRLSDKEALYYKKTE